MDSPFGLLAELTYRCPLRCPYCSNPTELAHESTELSMEDWFRVHVITKIPGSGYAPE